MLGEAVAWGTAAKAATTAVSEKRMGALFGAEAEQEQEQECRRKENAEGVKESRDRRDRSYTIRGIWTGTQEKACYCGYPNLRDPDAEIWPYWRRSNSLALFNLLRLRG